jgi:AcrR family transcriptional regulator
MGTHERKERERESRREEIVQAATKVFFDKGLQSATMDEIAEAAELSKGTLYLYYKSKEDLYLAVMNFGFDILHDMFTEALTKTTTVIEQLRALSGAYQKFSQKHRNYFRMFHFLQNPQLHKQVSEEMREISRLHNQRVWDVAMNVLRRGVQEGTLRSDVEPAEMAVLMWSSMNAILMQIDYQHEQWRQSMGIDLERVLRVSNELLLESLATDSVREELRRQQSVVTAS